MKLLKELTNINGKKILLRADFDIPVENGQIMEKFRIIKQKETLDYLLNNGAKVVLMAHISAVDSFSSILSQLETILGLKIDFIEKIENIQAFLSSDKQIGLLDNIRKFDGEESNDQALASNISKGFDYYVNNAFAVSHRNHMSVSAITKFLPSYAGLQLEKEIFNLSLAMDSPKEGKVVIIGGAKTESKVPVIRKFIGKCDKILIGGVVANDFLKLKGTDVGESKVDENVEELFSGLDINSPELVIPSDFNISENKILDIGPNTIQEFKKIISEAKMIIWNGPMGKFEENEFSAGTSAVAEAVAACSHSIIGGGDTVSAIDKLGLLNKYSFVSTGGGAMLEFLAGNNLPGISALE